MVELPYSTDVLFAVQAQYNAAWFPAAPALWLLTWLAVALVYRQRDRAPRVNDPADRFIALILGAGWILSGAGQQLTFMRDLDFLAVWYAAGLIVQGVLLAVVGGALGRLHWRFASDRLGHVGAALAVAGLLLHPVAILATGREPSAVPLAGTTPDATAIVTAGLLLAVRSAPPLFLFVIPLAWAGVAAVSGYLLGFWPDYLVAAAVAIALAVTIRQRFFLLR